MRTWNCKLFLIFKFILNGVILYCCILYRAQSYVIWMIWMHSWFKYFTFQELPEVPQSVLDELLAQCRAETARMSAELPEDQSVLVL